MRRLIFTILIILTGTQSLFAAVGCTLNNPDRDIKRLFRKATNYVPYAYYTVLSKKEVIGYVQGVNQKGTYGGIQLILATDPNGTILDFYYQKMTSPESKKFRDKEFTGQFIGLSLADFYKYDMAKKIEDPSEKNAEDYRATLRGLRKNLILHDEFKLNNKYDKLWQSLRKDKNDEDEKQQQ